MTQPRRSLIGFLAALCLVVGIFIGLQAWSDSVLNPLSSTQTSGGTYQLISAIQLAAVLFLFWVALRVARGAGWLFPVLLAAGAALYLYRMVILSGVFSANATYTTARAMFPDLVWFPLHLLFWLFGMGVWGFVDRTRARSTALRIVRLGLPIAGLAAFLLIHFALRSYTMWAGRVATQLNVYWPTILGLSTVLRPVLLIGTFYVLNEPPVMPRRRAFEWFLAGLLVSLATIVPPHSLGSSPGAWLPNAAVQVAVIGLAAWLLPSSASSS
jgi:hypothetical protein